jgi:hypothetical protein
MAIPAPLFSKAHLSDSLRNQEDSLLQKIHGEKAAYITAVSEESYVKHVFDNFAVTPLKIDHDGISVSPPFDKDVTIENGGMQFRVKKTFIQFSVPFTGDKELFVLRPSQFDLNPPREAVQGNEIQITMEQQGSAETLKSNLNRRLDHIQNYLNWQQGEIDAWNSKLEGKIKSIFSERKAKVIADSNVVSELGYPLKKLPGTSSASSYSTPIRNKVVAPRPAANSPAAKPQPFLDEEIFQEILKTLRDMELVMERSPSAFKDLDEEAIRTHFLLTLNGRFEGEATGETFNFQGKTDILLRKESRNIFIAECKFWTGPKGFTDTINQLLNYLTWRDTKAAILVFVRDTAISTVLAKIPGLLRDHPNFLSEKTNDHASEFRTQMKSARDEALPLHLVVQVYHVPSPESKPESEGHPR